MQEDEELVVVGCAEGQEWPMQEVQAPSWEVQVSIRKRVMSMQLQHACRGRGMCKPAGSMHEHGRRQGCRQHA